MHSPSASIADALSVEEVCPLCLDLYTAADECTCVVCRAPSCPGCAEVIDADGAVRCFACRPARSLLCSRADPRASAIAPKQSGGVPMNLPRPIPLPMAARSSGAEHKVQGEPPLPFLLTTSPRGVRALNPKPVGSVFVGLPALPPSLSVTLARARPATPLIAHVVRLHGVARARLASARTQLARQISYWSQRGRQRLNVLAVELPQHGRSLLQVRRALAERPPITQRTLAERLPGYRRSLLALYRSLKLPASLSARFFSLARPRARFFSLARPRARFDLPPRAPAITPPNDPSRSISL